MRTVYLMCHGVDVISPIVASIQAHYCFGLFQPGVDISVLKRYVPEQEAHPITPATLVRSTSLKTKANHYNQLQVGAQRIEYITWLLSLLDSVLIRTDIDCVDSQCPFFGQINLGSRPLMSGREMLCCRLIFSRASIGCCPLVTYGHSFPFPTAP